jgi:chemotaxis protein MotA
MMDIGSIIGLVVGFASLVLAFLLEGGKMAGLMQETAAMIVFGGTIGAVIVSTPLSELKKLPKVIGIAFKKKDDNIQNIITLFKELAVKTRRDGLLSLESELNSSNIDKFTKKALQMVVDGIEGNTVRSILETRVENISERHEAAAGIFEAAGGFAPTMGVIGTVMGLVNVLGSLSADPSGLGPKIAVAFVATLYGVGSANILWLPFATKLKAINRQEVLEKIMVIEGALLLQEGANPNTVASKLESFLQEGMITETD